MEPSRILGIYGNDQGPLLFISAGIHGNEPSGIEAFNKVLNTLNKDQPKINGKVIAVSGNIPALAQKERYIDEDLNRTWTIENIQSQDKSSVEKKQMFEIIDVLKSYSDKSNGKHYFLDCHTTSSASLPYISVQDVHDNLAYAKKFPTHIIKGFSDIVSGCIDHYMSRSTLTGFVFEGGQHTAPEAVLNHEGMIWKALHIACDLDFSDLAITPKAVEHIDGFQENQKTFQIKHRHALKDEDTFTMQPGFKNFQPIKKGELLAVHNGKEVHSSWDAYIFMPLYQAQGNDGFFVIEEV